MAILSGQITSNVSTFKPQPDERNPNPRTFVSTEVDGIKLSLPDGFDISKLPALLSPVAFQVLVNAQGKLRAVAMVAVPAALPR